MQGNNGLPSEQHNFLSKPFKEVSTSVFLFLGFLFQFLLKVMQMVMQIAK